MYFLIYDHFLTQQKYQRSLAQLETSLTDRGIAFKSSRLSLLKSVTDLAEFGIKQGAHTLVAVGSDRLAGSMVNTIARYPDVTFGVVPMGKESRIANFLGIPHDNGACEILSARKIEVLDLAHINDYFFLLGAEVSEMTTLLTLEFDHDVRVMPLHQSQLIGIYNFNDRAPQRIQKANPQDGWLNTIIVPERAPRMPLFGGRDFNWGRETDIPTRHVRLTSQAPATITVDGGRFFKTPLTIALTHHRLKVIVGKDRLF